MGSYEDRVNREIEKAEKPSWPDGSSGAKEIYFCSHCGSVGAEPDCDWADDNTDKNRTLIAVLPASVLQQAVEELERRHAEAIESFEKAKFSHEEAEWSCEATAYKASVDYLRSLLPAPEGSESDG